MVCVIFRFDCILFLSYAVTNTKPYTTENSLKGYNYV